MSTVNGGLFRRLLPITTRDFSGIQGNMTMVITAATHVPAVAFSVAEVVFRLHTGTSLGAGTSVTLAVHGDGYSDQDPSTTFDNTLASTSVSSWTGPQLQILTVPPGFGRYLRATVTGVQPAAPQALVVVVSVDLVLKGGDPEGITGSPNEFRGYGIR